MLEWRWITLGDLAEEVTVGFVGSMASEYQDSGVPFLRSQNVVPYRLNLVDLKYVDAKFHQKLSKSGLRAGDVVTVRTGKPGATAVIPPGAPAMNCADLVITRPGPEIDSNWLSYYINTAAAGFIATQLVGAVQQHFNISSAKAMKVCLPPLAEQRAIAEVIGAIDDKIAANAGLVEGVEALASTSFDSAVDEPRYEPLVNLARFVNGKAFTKKATGTGRVVIRIAELNSGIGISTVYNDLEVAEDHVARPGDLLFAWSGSLTVSRWYRPEGIINQHIFKVIPRDGLPLWLVHQVLLRKLADFRAIAADKATTMGHIQRRHLEEPVAIPSTESIPRMHKLMEGLWLRALAAEKESLVLATLRDTLLPELMSGRLRVKDAEQQVGEVL